MPMVRLSLVVVLCALPVGASAQAWADAYRAGDYEKAAELLHQVVIEANFDAPNIDPEPHQQLALLYASGQGVTPDPIAACALAQMAGMAIHTRPGPPGEDFKAYQARMDAGEAFVSRHCDPLTRADRLTASRSLGCYAFGMLEQVVTVGEQSVRISRRGIGLEGATDDKMAPLECPVFVVRVRATTIEPPANAAPGVKARQLVEMFTCHIRKDPTTATVRFPLTWHVFEVLPNRVEPRVAMQELFTAHVWPGRTLPAGIDQGLSLEMIRSGHVRWKLEGAPPKRGWIMLPENQRER